MKRARTRQRFDPHDNNLLVERIASEKVAALMKAVDFSPLYGAPECVVRLILPDAETLLAKHPCRWRREEIRQLQESVSTLPIRLLLAAHMEPPVM